MNWKARREEGIALVATLLVMTILLVMGSAFMSISSTETLIAINERNRMQAFHLAEAGVERAIAELNANGIYGQSGIEQGLGPGTYVATVTDLAPSPGVLDPKRIISVGNVPNGAASNRAMAQIEVLVQRGSPFQFGLFGLNTFKLEQTSSGTGVLVDSYDSSVAPYDPLNPGLEGDIHSNLDITIEDISTVKGNVSAVGTITVGPGSTITGTQTAGVSSVGVATNISYPACTGGVGISGSYAYNPVDCSLIVNANQMVTFDQGTHSFGKITVESGAKLAVNGPVTLYLTDQFTAQSGAVINTSKIPGNLMIFSSYIGPDAIMMAAGSGEFYAGIYALNGEVEFNDGGWQIYGAIVAKEIDIEDKSGFHFDKALTQAANPAGRFRPTAGTWREIFP